jgi:hypothetical protein
MPDLAGWWRDGWEYLSGDTVVLDAATTLGKNECTVAEAKEAKVNVADKMVQMWEINMAN